MNGTSAPSSSEEVNFGTTEDLFNHIDKNGDGVVDVKEMREFAKSRYGEEAEEMLEQVLNNYHKDENGKFTLEEVKNPPRESTRS